MKNITFEDLPKAMELVLEKVNNLENELSDIKKNFQPKDPDEFLTRQETIELLKINSTTLWNWTNKGKIKCHGIAHRRYYKRSDIMDAMVRFRPKNNME